MRPTVPPAVAEMARARAAARVAGDWAEADRLRDLIAAAGWIAVDRGTHYTMRPLHPPDLVEDGVVRYGRSDAVPSTLDEEPSAPATVVIVVEDDPIDPSVSSVLQRCWRDGIPVVLVANAPAPIAETTLSALTDELGGIDGPVPVEIVRTSDRLSPGAARNAGLRRARGAVVLVLGSGTIPPGDVVGPLRDALADAGVAIAGTQGLASADLHRFAPSEAGEPVAVEGTVAFRRDDYVARGPLDERFQTTHGLDAWWSLVLRDSGVGTPPRRALAIRDLPPAGPGPEERAWPDRNRAIRRDRYRLLGAFGGRTDLIPVTGDQRTNRPG